MNKNRTGDNMNKPDVYFEIVQQYRQLDENDKSAVNAMINALLSRDKYRVSAVDNVIYIDFRRNEKT